MIDKRASLRKHFQAEASQLSAEQQFKNRTVQLNALEDTLIEGFNTLLSFMAGKTTKTEVVNQLKSISTPDVDKVVEALSKLDKDILSNKLDLKPVVDALNGMKRELGLIPKTHPKAVEQKDSIKVTNLGEIELDTSDVVKAIKDLKLVAEAPIINEKEVDLKPLQDVMLDLLNAIKAQKPVEIPKFPEIPKTDLSKVEKKLDESNKHLKAITEKKFGGGGSAGHSTPYIDSDGKSVYVQLDVDGNIPVSGGGGSATALGNITTKNLVPTGIATANSSVEATLVDGLETLTVQVSGTYTGALSLQGTINGTIWVTFGAPGTFYNINTGVFNGTILSAAQSIYQVNTAGFNKIRITALAPVTGSATVTMRSSNSSALGALNAPLPAGTNVIGAITTIVPATGATNLGAVVDGVAVATKVGVLSIGVRDDVLATLTPVDNDYVEAVRTDSMGVQWVREKYSTISTVSTVTASSSSITLLTANTARRGAIIWNSSTAILYLKLGATASSSSFTVKLDQDEHYEVPFGYTGVIDGIWASATGDCRVTEIT